ncbi:MAG TPA: hypothetical protein VN673_00400 [Clostridia bacterium]|nr:hypothetical protein [Clostridia bacterium]
MKHPKIPHFIALFCTATLLAGCATRKPSLVTSIPSLAYAAKAPEPLTTSLFPSDQAVLSDEAVARILSSRIELPAKARVAFMRFPDARGGYWQNEDYVRLQESQADAITRGLKASEHIAEVTPLPSLMTPIRVSIPVLREAAVRMQADLLLVYRINTMTYSQYKALAKDRVKAYSTCELVLLDVRTGLVPFTRVVSRECVETKKPDDFDLSESMRRAEQTSSGEALRTATDDLANFLNSGTKKGSL